MNRIYDFNAPYRTVAKTPVTGVAGANGTSKEACPRLFACKLDTPKAVLIPARLAVVPAAGVKAHCRFAKGAGHTRVPFATPTPVNA